MVLLKTTHNHSPVQTKKDCKWGSIGLKNMMKQHINGGSQLYHYIAAGPQSHG